ncbi:Sec-independent protein translocase protein TatB [Luteithermobacter gelatinilyticus]|uniref:Sec-independent protein translocase protein TatB n=1 Tax=Luteithermobacter gelatinilyticus TaxID=2582913 RepID=UPI001107160B|nr:Sec-independent protein translocase protein TatB [Luteithermobacter gelatinilyticus]
MFDIGMLEMFVLLVLAIIVVGPRDLPKLMRNVGRFVRKVRELGNEFQSGLKQIADEVELEEVTRRLNEAGNIPLEDLEKRKPDILPEPDPVKDEFESKTGKGDAPQKPDPTLPEGDKNS